MLTTENFSLLAVLIPIHFCAVFVLFPSILSHASIVPLLKDKDFFSRLRMANTCCSTYVNTTLAFLSLWIVYNDEETIKDPVNGSSPISRFSLILSLSFLAYDILILALPLIRHHFFPDYSAEEMAKMDKSLQYLVDDRIQPKSVTPLKVLLCKEWDNKSPKERYSFLGHHLTAFLSFWWILSNDQLLYLANHRLIAELSTPFLNLMVLADNIPSVPVLFIDILKISFSIVFISCRMLTAPFFWGTVISVDLGDVPFWPRILQTLAPALLDVLNIYWAQKIIYKLIRALKRVESSVGYD
ncbi:Oidioi.mRNA.OKI2018_I69.XSR.g16976.t1.cds [Oikopleura dioica]|uniref:Oidioi.mRNA.OKI2018_I69.XSR.g16976.t1.cds n=1 Tax=Oikopleura dioica TaxID=34765 RepID=A0ABN7SJL0_OIKDI|nr:Oidioi.mRNA.OKI2018_I69.XSR.g16976.t1.cds [Oikopleura dioica]